MLMVPAATRDMPARRGCGRSAIRPSDGVDDSGLSHAAAGRATARDLPAIVLPHGGPGGARRMGLRLARPIFRPSGLCRASTQLSRLGGLWGGTGCSRNGFRSWRTSIGDITAGARWLAAQGIADPNRIGDRRLVLWRLCGAPVGRGRAGPVQGDRRDRAGHRSAAGDDRHPRLYQSPQHRRRYRHRAAYRAKVRRCRTSRAIARAGAAVPRRPRRQRQRHPFAADGRTRCAMPASEASSPSFPGSSTTSPIPRRARRCCGGSARSSTPNCAAR